MGIHQMVSQQMTVLHVVWARLLQALALWVIEQC